MRLSLLLLLAAVAVARAAVNRYQPPHTYGQRPADTAGGGEEAAYTDTDSAAQQYQVSDASYDDDSAFESEPVAGAGGGYSPGSSQQYGRALYEATPSGAYQPSAQYNENSVYTPLGNGHTYNYSPAQQYNVQAQQYNALAQQYNTQAQQYNAQAQQYSTPAQQYNSLAQHYNAPAQQYNAPAQQYNAPAQQYNALAQQYNTPAQQYNAPAQQYNGAISQYNPMQQYSSLAQQYNSPAQQYNNPVQQYNPMQQYSGYYPSQQYNLPQYNYGAPQNYDTSKSIDKDPKQQVEKSGYEEPVVKAVYYGGKYTGRCNQQDGNYYRDATSFVQCANGIQYVQGCAPGTRNRPVEAFQAGTYYEGNIFCDINLVDAGYNAHLYTPLKPVTAPKAAPAKAGSGYSAYNSAVYKPQTAPAGPYAAYQQPAASYPPLSYPAAPVFRPYQEPSTYVPPEYAARY